MQPLSYHTLIPICSAAGSAYWVQVSVTFLCQGITRVLPEINIDVREWQVLQRLGGTGQSGLVFQIAMASYLQPDLVWQPSALPLHSVYSPPCTYTHTGREAYKNQTRKQLAALLVPAGMKKTLASLAIKSVTLPG